jgi:hypothetical protein
LSASLSPKRRLAASTQNRASRDLNGSGPDNKPMQDIADLHYRATGVRVSQILPFEGDYIVLLDYYDASQARIWANLRRLRSDGDVVWAASTPSSSDMFTDVTTVV